MNRDRIWRLAQRHWFDALILVGIGLGIAGAVIDLHKKDGPRGPLWFDVVASIVILVPLFARRRFPAGAPLAAAAAVGLTSFVDGRLINDNFSWYVVGLAIAFLFGLHQVRTRSLAGFAFTLGVVAIVVLNDPGRSGGDFAWNMITFTIAWVVGFAVGRTSREAGEAKERAAQAEREREERAQLAVADERARIARELHDVVGHSVSVMTVQASAVRRLLDPDQEKVHQALVVVEQTGREALAEMRRMVGVLRRPEESPALAPQPSLEHLDKLVAHAQDAGLPVELRIEGDRVPLSGGLDMTAYRFVQEGLTNAVKHARAKHAEVLVRFRDGHVELTVTDDGPGGGDGDKGGHGLVGMRERISVYGGELEAGPQAGGGFRLHARLPIS